MKNRIFSIVLVLMMLLSCQCIVHAESEFIVIAPENVELYVNGVKADDEVTVAKTDKLEFASDGALVVKTDYGYYSPGSEFCVSDNMDFSSAYAIFDIGLEMVNGAQVRVGTGELEQGAQIDAQAGSGLRFIATADYNDTLIADGAVVFGIKVKAESSDEEVYIEAEKFQNVDKTVFSAAITNLNPSNYNRKYTATAYAVVTLANGEEVEFNSGEVTRSIYQVSVGILKNSSAETEEELPYTIDDAVKNVLSAYVNQTGIRLIYKSDGSMSASSVYTGDVFFNVSYSLNDDGSTFVTIAPLGAEENFANRVDIASWWKEYVRVNNSNAAIQWYIRDAEINDGVLTFTFKIPDYTFDQEDTVMVVASIDETSITGYKAGVLTEYALTDTVDVWGLASDMDDVVPGCVVLVGKTDDGKCGGIELLATLGLPIDTDLFKSNFGVYTPVDGSSRYKNIVTEMYSKSGTKLTCQNLPDTTKTVYLFKSSSIICYRVGIAMDGDTPVISVSGGKVTKTPSIFESTSEYHNYLYFRYDSSVGKVKECVFYCVPKNLDFSGDGEYSDIFSLNDGYRVIIE